MLILPIELLKGYWSMSKKMPEWLAKQRYNSADVRKQFKHTAKVLQNCDNPNLHNQKSTEHI